MAKEYKIKRTSGNIYHRNRNKTRSPVTIIGGVLLIAALVAIGWFVYPPIYDLITGNGAAPAPSQSDPMPVQPSAQEPTAEAPLTPAVEPELKIRAVYAPPAVMQDTTALEALLGKASAAGYNAVLFDAKDTNGLVLYKTGNPAALEYAAVSSSAFDLSAAIQLMQQYELRPVARLYMFKDHTASRVARSMAVMYESQEGMIWLDDYADQGGRSWLNPYNTAAQDYNIALAQECVDSGVAAVVAAGIQFPTARGGLDKAGYGDTGGKTKAEALSTFILRLNDVMEPKKALLLVEAPAVAVLDPASYEYLGSPANYASIVLNAMPNVWGTGSSLIGAVNPVQDPYSTVLSALRNTQGKTQARLVPYVQAFTDTNAAAAGKTYGQAEVKAQLDALGELGIEEYITYHPDGTYSF